MGRPALPESFAAGGELSDEVLEVLVVRVASGFGAQVGNGVALDLVEVREELGSGGVEEGEAGGVWRVRFLVQRAVERTAEVVRGEDVEASVA